MNMAYVIYSALIIVSAAVIVSAVLYFRRKRETVVGLPVKLVSLFAVLAAGIIAAGYMNFRQFRNFYQKEIENQLLSIADLKVSELVQWRNERIADGNVFYDNKAFNNLYGRFLSNTDDTDTKKQIYSWLNNVCSSYNYEQVLLLNSAGKKLISINNKQNIPDGQWAGYLNEAGRLKKSVLTDLHRVSPGSPVHLAVIVPVVNAYEINRISGFIVMVINPELYLYPFLKKWPTSSKTAETLLVRRDGDDVLYLNELRFRDNTALNFRIPLSETEKPAVMAVLGKEGVFEGTDYRGRSVVSALRSVPESGWFLVARVDTSEVNRPVKVRYYAMILIIAALVSAMGAVFWIIWRRRNEKFYREQYKITEELRVSEERFKNVFEHAPIGKSLTTTEGKININQAFCTMLGYSRDELEGLTWMEITHPDDIEFTQRNIDSLINGENEFARFQKRYMHKNGSTVWTDVSSYLQRGKSGEPLYFITAANDITARKLAEEERQKLIEELERSNYELQQFAYVASHDLQEPLRMISSYLQLIERRYMDKLDNDANDFIKFAVDGANRLQSLIVGLLEFSRIKTSGKEFREVDVNRILNKVLTDIELQVNESGAVIEREKMPVINGDEAQIFRLFQNIIQNGIKFRREGVKPHITISFEKSGKEYIFIIKDNGIGIEEQYFERIFIIFQRLHTREEYPGTGIGLSICKRIVERHGGRIWIESKQGEGSSFCFTIPENNAHD